MLEICPYCNKDLYSVLYIICPFCRNIIQEDNNIIIEEFYE
jgi:hypothetical protein